ncbi:hypothetical protein RQP46_000795 [Phenoliferia psychrophenolica]
MSTQEADVNEPSAASAAPASVALDGADSLRVRRHSAIDRFREKGLFTQMMTVCTVMGTGASIAVHILSFIFARDELVVPGSYLYQNFVDLSPRRLQIELKLKYYAMICIMWVLHLTGAGVAPPAALSLSPKDIAKLPQRVFAGVKSSDPINGDQEEVPDALSAPGKPDLSTLPPLEGDLAYIHLPDNHATCAICRTDYVVPPEGFDAKDWTPETLRLLRCGHAFHTECIDEWLTSVGSCPTCGDRI